MKVRCPHCQNAIEIVADIPLDALTCPSCGSHLGLLNETLTQGPSEPRTVGHFVLLELLGCGHFGEVWMARDTKLDRTVAVKIPRMGELNPSAVEFFSREARAAAQLRHPHIVPVHEVGRDGETLYIVSDFIRGVNLANYLTEHRYAPRDAAALCASIAEALHHAHTVGVIHRDLKPANIMLDGEGQPHLMDFGLAKRDSGEITLTVAGKILGTPAYMSPEQARGDGHQADGRSDVYSLGVVIYELLTGERPFQGDTQLLVHQVLFDEPRPPRQRDRRVPRELETICLKAMEKAPAQRYATAQEVAADLHRYLRGEPITAKRVSCAERAWRWGRRNPARASIGALSVAVVILALVAVLGRDNGPAMRSVRLTTLPEGATVSFIPLDVKTGEPRLADANLPRGTTPLDCKLAPGEFLVVAVLPNGDFHEVFRRVPQPDEDEWRGGYPHGSWTVGTDGRIDLPLVRIAPVGEFADMAHFAGSDDFIVGAKELSVSPPHHRRVSEFLLDTAEVTVGQFDDVMHRLPDGLAADPPPHGDAVSFVNFDEAVAYAELVGKRLMTEVEYEFAATDGGRLDVPWGGRTADIHDWPFGPVRNPIFDRLDHEPPVFGLYSNVAEWTSSWGTLYPDAKGRPRPSLPAASVERIVRGGSGSVMMGQPDAKEWRDGPRTRVMFLKSRQEPGLGFRCARSVMPHAAAR